MSVEEANAELVRLSKKYGKSSARWFLATLVVAGISSMLFARCACEVGETHALSMLTAELAKDD